MAIVKKWVPKEILKRTTDPNDEGYLTGFECRKWNIAFEQFFAKRGINLTTGGFASLKFGVQARPKRENFEDFDEDYIDSLTRVE
jgi:hypothetical protein